MTQLKEVILDTETTGMDPAQGHKIVEIGALELINHVPTGRSLQIYINPERPVPPEATAVHGLSDSFLADKPVFSQIYTDFLDFIEGAQLVIHNADFDMRFLNWELKNVGHVGIGRERVVDTLTLARRKFPGSPANLDALCRRFGIDNSARKFHGALLDSELLAEVYLELLGGRQHGLGLATEESQTMFVQAARKESVQKILRPARVFTITEEEQEAHESMVALLKNPLWKKAS